MTASDQRTWIASTLAAALAVAILAVGLRYGALVAGGSDSYGYVSQAGLWQRGSLVVHQDLMRTSPWPLADWTWTPLGYRPSPHERGAIVPIYSPGYPLLMALFQLVAGFQAGFLVVPLCGALTVWWTYVIGRRVIGAPWLSLWGALLVAVSPAFLYQLMNAMSDVPVMAGWTLALLLVVVDRPLAAGFATSVAIAIRPNLAPLALPLGLWLAARNARSLGEIDWTSPLLFALGAAPAVAGIAWLYDRLYESAWTSGYGSTGDLYSFANTWTNVRQFSVWIADTETPLIALAIVYFARSQWFADPRVPRARWLLAGIVAMVVLSYLFYAPYDAWWYLRFLLPMWPVMMLLTALGLDAIARRWLTPVYPAAMAIVVVALAAHALSIASTRYAFDLGRAERRYIDTASYIAKFTDPNAVMFSVQHSGSIRLYSGRLTLKYDVLDPTMLDQAVEYLQSIGRRPYFVLDGGEVDAFRKRFAATSRLGALDWPPVATLGGSVVAIYDPIDQRRGVQPMHMLRTDRPRAGTLADPAYAWPPALRIQ